MKQIAYLGWLGAGNLGDEACFELFQNCVHSIVNETRSGPVTCVPITIVESNGRLYAYQPGERLRSRSEWRPADFDYVVLGGGSLLNADRYIKALRVAQTAGVPTAIWGTGFDGLPHALAAKVKKGVDLRNERHAAPLPHPWTADVLRACRHAGVRGPVTAAWLEACGCGSPSISGDPGLLFQPTATPASAKSKASNRRAASKRAKSRIAVIWGMSSRATHHGLSHAALTQTVAHWLGANSDRWTPLICAMWSHDVPAARELALCVGTDVELVEEPLTLDSFAVLMQSSELTLSYRLHGCILSAACGTPFCSIAYRSKTYDFARSIGAAEWLIDPVTCDVLEGLDRWLSRVTGRNARSARAKIGRAASRHTKTLATMVRAIVSELDHQ